MPHILMDTKSWALAAWISLLNPPANMPPPPQNPKRRERYDNDDDDVRERKIKMLMLKKGNQIKKTLKKNTIKVLCCGRKKTKMCLFYTWVCMP